MLSPQSQTVPRFGSGATAASNWWYLTQLAKEKKPVQTEKAYSLQLQAILPLITPQLKQQIPSSPRLIAQMQLFPTDHDDGPDALQGAVDELKKQLGG